MMGINISELFIHRKIPLTFTPKILIPKFRLGTTPILFHYTHFHYLRFYKAIFSCLPLYDYALPDATWSKGRNRG